MVSAAPYVPDQGHAVWITLDPQAGHEQAGRRPALVLSPTFYNDRTGLAILTPITNRAKGYPFEVPLPQGLSVTGVVLADQAKSLDWRARHAALICVVPPATVKAVLQRLATLLPGIA